MQGQIVDKQVCNRLTNIWKQFGNLSSHSYFDKKHIAQSKQNAWKHQKALDDDVFGNLLTLILTDGGGVNPYLWADQNVAFRMLSTY